VAKILLVEDDNNLREIYEARLTAEGYEIIAAQNGEEALVLAKQHHPDLVVSDVMMPRISGYEMLDILRNTEELKDTPVIMLTALGQSEDKDRAGKLGADKYLVKSQVTLEDIVNSAKSILAAPSGSPVTTTADPGMTETTLASTDPLVPSVAQPADQPDLAAATPVDTVMPPLSSPVSADDPTTTSSASASPAAEMSASATNEDTAALTPPASTMPETAPLSSEPSVAEPNTAPALAPLTAPPVVDIPEPSGTPVSVEDIIETQPDAQGQIEASSEKIEQVQNTPLGETDLLTGEQKVIADEEAALVAHMNGTEPTTPEVEPEPTPVPTPTEVAAPSVQTENQASMPETQPLQPTVTPLPIPQPEAEEVVVAPTEINSALPTPDTSPAAGGPGSPATPSTETDNVAVIGKKVIQPPQTEQKPDLNQLLAAEEAKTAPASDTTSSITPSGVPAGAPPKPASKGFDPNSIAL
jgi:CheY-like chemotaxis protein